MVDIGINFNSRVRFDVSYINNLSLSASKLGFVVHIYKCINNETLLEVWFVVNCYNYPTVQVISTKRAVSVKQINAELDV